MILANYINDLLYRYDCVIIHNLGGFVTNKIGADVNNYTHTFYPPSKQLSFNVNLRHNDGLLANYIASVENISFEEATKRIANTVVSWNAKLTTSSLEIEKIGTLFLNAEKQLQFEPNKTTNFLPEAFGLTTVTTPAIKRFTQNVKPLIPVVNTIKETPKKQILPFVKYAATVAVLLALGIAGYNYNTQKEVVAKQQNQLEQKIQEATFIINTPLPTINLTAEKENLATYHIVAGAFKFAENAEKKLEKLKQNGFTNARVLGKNKWGLTQVSYTSISDKNKAINQLHKIQRTVSKEAWLLVE